MKLLVCLAVVCLVGAVVAEDGAAAAPPVMSETEMTQFLGQASARAARIAEALKKFKAVGLQQITKLRELILANQHCEAMEGVEAPKIPTPPPQPEGEAEPEPQETLTAEQASAALHKLGQTLTMLEHKIARMTHVGKTQIDIFSRFAEATGGKLCESEEQEEEEEGED